MAVGVYIAPDDGPFVANPTWVDISTLPGVYVESWSIDRGRLTELDDVGTGTARIQLFDKLGTLNPYNTSGTLYGRIDPMKQMHIYLTNPVEPTLHSGTVFRGFVEDWSVDVDITQNFSRVSIDLVDAFDVLNSFQLRSNSAGDATNNSGDIIYAGGTAITPQVRIESVLTSAGWPAALYEVFTGNVSLQAGTYSPNTSALSVIQETSDAEFPGVGLSFVNRQGTVTWHGRMARFRPDVAQYRISQWNVGDLTAFAGDSTTAVISGLSFHRGKDSVINSALATPQNIAGTSIAGNLSEDLSSIDVFGYRTWSAENLYTGGGIASNVGDPVAETALFADYYRENFNQPATRINQIRLTSASPAHPTATRIWRVLCQADISDIFSITTDTTGSSQDYFVEGIHYNAMAAGTSFHHIEFTADVSPRANYDVATFGTTATT